MATHAGGCHCGNIAFELDAEITEGYDCNCSMCRKRGGLLAFFPREALRLKTPLERLGTYRFNTRKLDHHFCPECGIAPFSEGIDPKTGAKTVAVNLCTLPGVDLAAVKVVQVDGASF